MNILDLPFEMRWVILSNVTDPFDIIEISQSNSVIRNTLKQSVTKLTTDRDLLMLDQNWLNDYSFLTDIDDSIIFQLNNMTELQIPKNLKKFNLFVNISLDIFDLIFDKVSDNLSNYTIRFVTERASVIIDRGFYRIGVGLDKVGAELENYLNNLGLIDYLSDTNELNHIVPYYPNKAFRNFVADISYELEIDLFDYLPIYNQYGYVLSISSTIQLLISSYIRIKELKIDEYNWQTLNAKWDDLLLKYANELSVDNSSEYFIFFMLLSENKPFKSPDIATYSHFYLTSPGLYPLCIDDYNRISILLNNL